MGLRFLVFALTAVFALPCVFNATRYTRYYPDLNGFSDETALKHWIEHGINEGRTPCGREAPLCSWNSSVYRLHIGRRDESLAKIAYVKHSLSSPLCDTSSCKHGAPSRDLIVTTAVKLQPRNVYRVSVVSNVGEYSSVIRLPDVYYLGFPKAATSSVYHVLKHGFKVYLPKEYCPDYSNYKKLTRYFDTLSGYVNVTDEILSSCLNSAVFESEHRIFPSLAAKAIFSVRDRSTYAYACFNFWCLPSIDRNCGCGDHWRSRNRHAYRSPSLFHELSVGYIVHNNFPFFDGYFAKFSDVINNIVNLITRENVYVFKSEDISLNTTARSIFAFLGLEFPRNLDEVTLMHRYNVHDLPGTDSLFAGKYNGSYSSIGHAPILEKTRELINNYFEDDRQELKTKFGVIYP